MENFSKISKSLWSWRQLEAINYWSEYGQFSIFHFSNISKFSTRHQVLNFFQSCSFHWELEKVLQASNYWPDLIQFPISHFSKISDPTWSYTYSHRMVPTSFWISSTELLSHTEHCVGATMQWFCNDRVIPFSSFCIIHNLFTFINVYVKCLINDTPTHRVHL